MFVVAVIYLFWKLSWHSLGGGLVYFHIEFQVSTMAKNIIGRALEPELEIEPDSEVVFVRLVKKPDPEVEFVRVLKPDPEVKFVRVLKPDREVKFLKVVKVSHPATPLRSKTETCTICQDTLNYQKCIRLACGHRFCFHCVGFQSGGGGRFLLDKCPNCRKGACISLTTLLD